MSDTRKSNAALAAIAEQHGWLWSPVETNAQAPTLILAHGAGAPMDSAWLQDLTAQLNARGVQVLRFEFAYMAQRRVDGRKRPPSRMPTLLDEWRAVYRQVRAVVAGQLVIGGKSMGGRAASMLADELHATGLVCLGYPFHPANKPERPRIAHLAQLATPALIVQGERDPLGNRERVNDYSLAPALRWLWLHAADHDFKPLARNSLGVTQQTHMAATAEAVAAFIATLPSA